MKVLRFMLAIILGCVALGATVLVMQAVGHAVYPPPTELIAALADAQAAMKAGDTDAQIAAHARMGDAIRAMPVGAMVLLVLAWVLGAVVGAGLAAWVAPRGRMLAALFVTALDIMAILVNCILIPHPAWVPPVAVVACGAAGIAAGLCVRRWKAHAHGGAAVSR